MPRQPMLLCPYCHAKIPEADYIEHDIRSHDGLARMRNGHQLMCEEFGGGRCICRVDEYEKVARQLVRRRAMANPFGGFSKLLNAAFACPKCGKSTLVVGLGTGGVIHEEPVTPETHCTCPGGPVDMRRTREEAGDA